MNITNFDTTFLERCLAALGEALNKLEQVDAGDVAYDIYRAACIKEFEIVLEQCGKLLRKRLADYFESNQRADRLTFKDLFRHAAKHDLIDDDAAERWAHYRDNRNSTAHDYGEAFAEKTLKLLPEFIVDARSLVDAIGSPTND